MHRSLSACTRVLALFSTLLLGSLSGCGEPTGEDAYSQKFEKSADPKAAGAAPDVANPYDERREDIKKAQTEPAKKAAPAKR
ncbi:MAG: hypothetical protein SFX72_05595 [Isosphaeraceae bacterium]|nr:hypothetical protein [Isosphaeraceae bacterium]